MGVCKFFMEGYCKFGSRCKYDHVDPYRAGYDSPRSGDYVSERPQGTSILKTPSSSFGRQEFSHSPQHAFVQPQQHHFSQHSFNQSPQHGYGTPQQSSFVQKSAGLKYNVQDVMQSVLRDITQLEKGGQWQLSCYSPLRELPNMPGLEDYSPEELRWECYKALRNGSLPLCQVIVQQLYGNVAKINNELKRKESGYSIIDRWLRDSEQTAAQNTSVEQSVFTPPFGGNSVAANAFSSPFFTPSETQGQQQQQPQPQPQSVTSSFTFSLPPQQQPTHVQPFQQSSPVFPGSQTSAFASQRASPFSPHISAPVIDSQVYSPSEALSEAELKAFQADRFVLGCIPTKPPPRALCNM